MSFTWPTRKISETRPEAFARVVVSGLFLALVWRLGTDYLKTGRPTDMLLLIGEGLVVVLTCLRRCAISVDRRLHVRLITAASMVAPMLIKPDAVGGVIPEWMNTCIAAFGLMIVVGGKLSLGYSFGLLPANRGIVNRGLYRIVRHPIYLGYLMTHLPFLASNPSPWNIAVLVGGDAALVIRAFYEEHTLSQDPSYRHYREHVRWRLVPGVC
ncbi:MAG TPA: isoprenylcysteine carboxyl methyltransferase [Casimicrobiaceae bacterium]|nr:isoprenylcysteine carboxyl methyltransferase [Casimicrobiaceae bacterium]